MNERWVDFGDSRVRLVCRHLDWGKSIDFLLGSIPHALADPGGEACTTLTLSRSDGDGAWCVTEASIDDSGVAAGEQSRLSAESSQFERTAHLLGRLSHGLAVHSGPGPLFHAGAVDWGGRQFVIPGGVGRGKSTLIAWLAVQGGRYLSDELVYWPSVLEPFEALTRPLNLRWAGWQALQPGLDIFDGEVERILRQSIHQTGEGILISPQALPSGVDKGVKPPLLLFPHYRPQSSLTLERLSPARTGKALMETLVNGRNLPDHGFGMAVQLAARLPAWRLMYGDFDQLDDAFWAQLHKPV